jgi:hypothetical protein
MADQQQVRVGRDDNAVTVEAHGHDWIVLAGADGEVARELGGSDRVTFAAAPGSWTVQTDGTLDRVAIERIESPFGEQEQPALLRLESDAPDRHVVDGVGEIPADGTSRCTVAVEKLDAGGQPLRRRRDSDEVFLRTTGGLLQDERGRPLRSLRLREGRGNFRLVSEATPRIVTVEAVGHPPLAGASLRIEFV